MKKVINITLGSIVFAIDEDAYGALAVYLEQIKSNLKNSDDTQEIIDDVEIAIAEKFMARKRSEKMAVTAVDVEAVISEMGSPVEFGEGEEAQSATSEETSTPEPETETKKRLYRDKDNAVVAGVSSGLGNYFGIDPVIVRLLFIVAVFFNGIGLLAYIILWLVVPVAETTADKYAMRGERVTLKDISERVKKNLDNLEQFDYSKTKGAWASVRSFLDKFFRVIGSVMMFMVLLLRYVAGLALIVFGALGVAGVVSAYSVLLLSEKVLLPSDVQMVLETLQGSTLGIIALSSSFIVMTIPLIVFIVIGASLLAKRSYFTVQNSVTLSVIWIVAAVLAGTTGALQAEQVMQQITPSEEQLQDSSVEPERKDVTVTQVTISDIETDRGVYVSLDNGERIMIAQSDDPETIDYYFDIVTYFEAFISPDKKFVALQGAQFEDQFMQVYDAQTGILHELQWGRVVDWTPTNLLRVDSCNLAGEECTYLISENSEEPWEFVERD